MKSQAIPLALTFLTFLCLTSLLWVVIFFLNTVPFHQSLSLTLRFADILVGLTIYLKTSVDFSLFLANLMAKSSSWTSRIAIELGTALGNALGTILVIIIWTFFKEIPLLLFLMMALASFALLGMAKEGLEEFLEKDTVSLQTKKLITPFYIALQKILSPFTWLFSLFLPNFSSSNKQKGFFSLFLFSVSIPFVLGLDDFAGYIPLFSLVKVFGFAVGVFLGHMLLTLSLFSFPAITIKVIKLPIITFVGSGIFLALALFGGYEAVKLLIGW
ncbi:MAG TPA: hypothetical protein VFQ63_00870 [Patescibacteria group bacterium]|nr:hypothetical protein [Patescibacteria group bacterium]